MADCLLIRGSNLEKDRNREVKDEQCYESIQSEMSLAWIGRA